MLKLLEAPVLLCLSAAIMYGESRGAILGVLLGMVLTLSKRIGIIVPGALALVVLAGMNIAAVGRMDRLSSGESSAEGRLKSWAQGWYMLRSHPLLGVGPRKFHDHHRVAPHSSVVQVAAETGIPGLFCWIGFFFLAIREPLANVIPWGKTIFRARSPAPPPSNQTSQLAIAQIVCFFTGLFLSRAYVLLPYFLTALAIAARNLDLYKDGQAPAAVPFLDRDVQHVAIVFCATMIAWRFIIRAYVFGP
jgi:O-antigen ligase